jgi:hypothetical protein
LFSVIFGNPPWHINVHGGPHQTCNSIIWVTQFGCGLRRKTFKTTSWFHRLFSKGCCQRNEDPGWHSNNLFSIRIDFCTGSSLDVVQCVGMKLWFLNFFCYRITLSNDVLSVRNLLNSLKKICRIIWSMGSKWRQDQGIAGHN